MVKSKDEALREAVLKAIATGMGLPSEEELDKRFELEDRFMELYAECDYEGMYKLFDQNENILNQLDFIDVQDIYSAFSRIGPEAAEKFKKAVYKTLEETAFGEIAQKVTNLIRESGEHSQLVDRVLNADKKEG